MHTLIPGWLRIQVLRNYGFFQGMFSESLGSFGTHITLIIGALVTAAIVVWAWKTPSGKTLRHGGFACMIGGALGNILDRAIYGYVLDFLQVGPLGVYNLADFALMLGAGLLLIDFWRTESGGA